MTIQMYIQRLRTIRSIRAPVDHTLDHISRRMCLLMTLQIASFHRPIIATLQEALVHIAGMLPYVFLHAARTKRRVPTLATERACQLLAGADGMNALLVPFEGARIGALELASREATRRRFAGVDARVTHKTLAVRRLERTIGVVALPHTEVAGVLGLHVAFQLS